MGAASNHAMKYGIGYSASLYLLGSCGIVNLSNHPLYDSALFGCLITISQVALQAFTQVHQWQNQFVAQVNTKKWLNPASIPIEEKTKYAQLGLKLVGVAALGAIFQKYIMNTLGSPISYPGLFCAAITGRIIIRFLENRRPFNIQHEVAH